VAGSAILELPELRRLVPGEPLVTLSSLIKFYRACPAAPSGHPPRAVSGPPQV
jgi:hypothetical protein